MYDELGGITCRKAVMKDLPSMYNFIKPNITDESGQRKLSKHLKYYISIKTTCIAEDKDKNLVGFYAGSEDFIHFFICKGGPKAALLLFYTVLCGIHNKYTPSYFEVFESNKDIFSNLRTPEGKGCIIDPKTGKGEVPPLTKKYVEQLYRRFKNE